LPANLQKLPTRQNRKPHARLARAHEPTRPSSLATTPYRSVQPSASTHAGADLRVISLFGAIGALVPLIILSLEWDIIPYIGLDRLLPFLRVLFWPASVLRIGTPEPTVFGLASFFTFLLNIATYLVIGSLVFLGLHPRRSIIYLTIVGLIYLMLVSVAAFCELLLT
jgi:hypothetical protein